jgi:hypothetical protein
MGYVHTGTATVATASHTGAGVAPFDWLLWGALALAFAGLYIGVNIWIRRPKIGERPPTAPNEGSSLARPSPERETPSDGSRSVGADTAP